MSNPTLRTIHPQWAELHDRFASLIASEEALIAEMKPLADELRRNAPPEWADKNPPPPLAPKKLRDRTVELIGNIVRLETAKPESAAPVHPRFALKDKVDGLSQELAAVREAIELMRPALYAAKMEGSEKLCAARRPEYQEVVSRMCRAALDLGNALLDHHRFTDEMRLQGATWSPLKPINIAMFGAWNESFGLLPKVITAAANAGHIDFGVPREWSAGEDHYRPHPGDPSCEGRPSAPQLVYPSPSKTFYEGVAAQRAAAAPQRTAAATSSRAWRNTTYPAAPSSGAKSR